MGNFEKLGILVIIVLVVVIIVVAAWGVRPDAVTENGDALRATVTTRGDTASDRVVAPEDRPDPPLLPVDEEREDDVADRVPPPPPPVPQQKIHVVKSGESLWKIAATYYGKGHLHKVIAKANPDVDPDNLKVGTKLVIPALSTAAPPRETSRRTEPAAGERTYKIKRGDTVWDIARDELGRGSRYKDILELNPDLDPNRMPLNSKILLPRR